MFDPGPDTDEFHFLSGRKSSGPFLPTSLDNLEAWFKAGTATYTDVDFTTPAITNDAAVAGWKDQSGKNHHLTQSGATAKALLKTNVLNTESGLSFDGANDRMVFPAVLDLTDFTAFWVLKYGNMARGELEPFWTDINGTSHNSLYYNSATQMKVCSENSASVDLIVTSPGSTVYHVHTFDNSGGTIRHFLDGTANGVTSAIAGHFKPAAVMGCGSGYCLAILAELIIYSGVLTDANRGKVTTYLGTKYGLTVS